MDTTTLQAVHRRSTNGTSWIPDDIVFNSSYQSGISDVKITADSPPGWRKCLESGGILRVNPYTVSHTDIVRQPAIGTSFDKPPSSSFYTDSWTGSYYLQSLFSDNYPTLPGFSSGDINNAVNEAISRASSAKWQVLVTAGEAKETFSMLLSAAKALRHPIDAALAVVKEKRRYRERLQRSGQYGKMGKAARKALDDLCTFGGAWLSVRYGWIPLLSDVKSAVNALTSSIKEGDTFHGTGIQVLSSSEQKSFHVIDGTTHRIGTSNLTYSLRLRSFALCQVTNPTVATYGLNPFVSGYELVTLSFVLDWFWNIGSWLAALSVRQSGFNLAASGYSIKTEYQRISNADNIEQSTSSRDAIGGFYGMSESITVSSFQRTPASGGLPSVNFSISGVHLADLSLILAQYVKKLAT